MVKRSNTLGDYKFEKLTLNENANIDIYEEALDFVFNSDDIKNVAISGAYGAGKSSVLASYKKKHTNRKYIHISLAHFESEESQDKKITESILEGKILNQLIHQIPLDKIPQTNFKIKRNVTRRSIILSTLLFMAFIVCVLFIGLFERWEAFVLSLDGDIGNILQITTNKFALLVAGIIITVLFSLLVYSIIKAQRNKKILKKVNVQGNEIEIFEDKDESYFDKYLNEVLYLFENSGADVIVFEDMDRFEMHNIFERLREVNTLANYKLQQSNKIIRFFYLLRDDIFMSKDRTKFFDYIIPIVPVVDGTNAYDQFIEHLNNNKILDSFNKQFLQGISLYIDDMRLLKNICNEFLIYYNRLNTIELDCDKMFAIITYKNLFPKDFSELQIGKGYIFSLFSHKDTFINAKEEKIKEEIDKINEEIIACENEFLQNEHELELVRQDRDSKKNYGNYEEKRKRTAEYNEWYQNVYPNRKKAIEDKKLQRVSKLKLNLSDLEEQLTKIKSSSLAKIITRDNINEVFHIVDINEIGLKRDFNEIKSSDYFALLKYLIRNGYIDETYADYMTYFYENSLSRIDKIFLRCIRDKNAKEFTYSLKNPALVIKYLYDVDFEEEEILNFDLFSYLIKTLSDSNYLMEFIYQLRDNKRYDFLTQYFSYDENFKDCACLLNKYWPEFFSEVYKDSLFSQHQIRQFSIFTILFCVDDVIENVNINNCLTSYVSNSTDYLNIPNVDVDQCVRAFKLLGVAFSKIDYEASEENLLDSVYQNSLYQLNYNNLSMFLMKYYDVKEYEIRHKNYSIVYSLHDKPICSFVLENINEYIQVILDNCDDKIDDTEDAALDIINNEDLSHDLKIAYIEVLSCEISDISKVGDYKIWPQIFESGNVCKSENNICCYFLKYDEFDSTLVDFVNSFNSVIDMSKADINDEEKSRLFGSCIKTFNICDDKYKQLLCSMHLIYNSDFPIKDVPKEKMVVLIDAGIVTMNSSSLTTIRSNYPDECMYFIKHNIQKYVDIMSESLFSHEEMLKILSWNIDDQIKIDLLSFDKKEISITNSNYSTKVCVYILNNNLDENDFPSLYVDYDNFDQQVKTFIYDYAASHIDTLYGLNKNISFTLIKELLGCGDIAENKRINLFASIIPRVSKDKGKICSEILKCNNYEAIFDSRKKPKFETNEINELVLNAFVNAGWIYEYVNDENNPEFYVVHRNKPANKKTLGAEV